MLDMQQCLSPTHTILRQMILKMDPRVLKTVKRKLINIKKVSKTVKKKLINIKELSQIIHFHMEAAPFYSHLINFMDPHPMDISNLMDQLPTSPMGPLDLCLMVIMCPATQRK